MVNFLDFYSTKDFFFPVQVLLSEIYSDPSITRVVVKELKANASSKEQNDFLQQGDPYRLEPYSFSPYILFIFFIKGNTKVLV